MLKIGVFGTGHLGKFHLNNWKEIKNTQLMGFYEPNDATAKYVAEKYGLKRYDTAAQLMDDIDAADIVAPTDHHFALCEMALRKAKTCVRRKTNGRYARTRKRNCTHGKKNQA